MCTHGSVPVPGEEGAVSRWREVVAEFGAAVSTHMLRASCSRRGHKRGTFGWDPVLRELLPVGSRGNEAGLGGQRLYGNNKSPWEEVVAVRRFE